MGQELRVPVLVRGVVLMPGDPVPEWAEKAITNPKAWAEAPAPGPEPVKRGPGRPRKTTE